MRVFLSKRNVSTPNDMIVNPLAGLRRRRAQAERSVARWRSWRDETNSVPGRIKPTYSRLLTASTNATFQKHERFSCIIDDVSFMWLLGDETFITLFEFFMQIKMDTSFRNTGHQLELEFKGDMQCNFKVGVLSEQLANVMYMVYENCMKRILHRRCREVTLPIYRIWKRQRKSTKECDHFSKLIHLDKAFEYAMTTFAFCSYTLEDDTNALRWDWAWHRCNNQSKICCNRMNAPRYDKLVDEG